MDSRWTQNSPSKWTSNGVIGNYDPLQGELADNVTFRALRAFLLTLRVAAGGGEHE